MTPIGPFVVEKRERLGIPQYQLAERVGVDPSYINRIENGLKSPGNLRFLKRLAEGLELTPEETTILFELATSSQRVIRMPKNLSPQGYLVTTSFMSKIARLSPVQLKLIESVLDVF